MGDSGSRRSTLVSRLPIFRKSISRRHDSLPPSPSPSNAAGIHSSSPSSTNSSSGSTGKRRSLFRTPSISFPHRKGAEPKQVPPMQSLSIANGAQPGQGNSQKLSLEEQAHTRGRHAGGSSSSRSKKMTRSLTEDFQREKEHSGNKSVFINCLSSGRSETDDSGFAEEAPRRSVKQSTKKLLTKSFSSHYRFCKPVPQVLQGHQVPQGQLVPQSGLSQEVEPGLLSSSPPCSRDVPAQMVGSSLPSPLLSADLTTVQTPSEFLTLTEDSLSEPEASHSDLLGLQDSTSHIAPHPAASKTATLDLLGTVPRAVTAPGKCRIGVPSSTEPDSAPCSSAAEQKEVSLHINGNGQGAQAPFPGGSQREEHRVSYNGEAMLGTSPPRKPGFYDQHRAIAERIRGTHPMSDSRLIPSADHHLFNRTAHGCDTNPAKVLASSLSPYREGRFIERRLRSSSEGTAGSGRTVFKPKDGNVEDGTSLRKPRAGSSSSKMNSMDVLNNLGSCELDEDDLMLDLEFLEEQNLQPPVCREDSYHSVVSCAAVGLTPVEPTTEVKKREDLKFPEPSKQSLSLKLSKDADQDARFPHPNRMPSSPSTDWPLLSMEDNGGSLDSLPFRLMLQDCTAVKTLLLKMKRVLQESADMSPGSSTTSLPVSPLTEEPSSLPFKEKAQHFQKAFASRVDKSTQTELLGYDALWNPTCIEGLFKKSLHIST
ncbi:serine-rich coiled-coil domain-containing protein 1 isoform X2 [Erinaceus europaeus]|uniref:Serine-rich coiled-coil domain-containing protein 1 isoform X2 n=1 Tax=Erinaceus europaeus TaxID=9365 RepID=A0ABM3X4H0_ERIEU|nr:serine-rich coiled-coil domain-containing protein 1 isoform X2 [Erinaceus europaeus]